MSKHTPGPWNVTSAGIGAKGGREVVDDGLLRPADACLIAAAPDLLETLKMARDCIAYCRRAHKDAQSGDGVPVEVFIDNAIAKAEGREQ